MVIHRNGSIRFPALIRRRLVLIERLTADNDNSYDNRQSPHTFFETHCQSQNNLLWLVINSQLYSASFSDTLLLVSLKQLSAIK